MTTWRKLITRAMSPDESWDDVVSCTLSDEQLDIEFDNDFGITEGIPFTLWTKKRVYFPVGYDGLEWVGYVSRKPDGKPTSHIGA